MCDIYRRDSRDSVWGCFILKTGRPNKNILILFDEVPLTHLQISTVTWISLYFFSNLEKMVLFCDSRDVLWGCFRKEISGKSWQHWKKFLMFYLIACNTNLINADWTVANELTSYISFASISYLCALFLTSKFVYVQKPVTIQLMDVFQKIFQIWMI